MYQSFIPIVLSLTLVLWRCTKLADPSHSKVGTLSLVLLFGAWATVLFVGGARDVEPRGVLGALIFLGLVAVQALAATVLAIVCLATWKRRPAHVRHGIGSSVTTLVLVTLGSSGFLFFQVIPRWKELQGTDLGAVAIVKLRVEDFEVRPPSSRWRRLDDDAETEACLVLRRTGPEIVMAVVVEEVGELALAELQSAVRSNIESNLDDVHWGESAEFVGEGVEFERSTFEARSPDAEPRFAYTHYLTLHHDRVYQITFAMPKRSAAAEAECDAMMRGFRFLDEL